MEMVRELRACGPPSSSLGAHLLSLRDPKTDQLLDDYQLEAELSTFFGAGEGLGFLPTHVGLCILGSAPASLRLHIDARATLHKKLQHVIVPVPFWKRSQTWTHDAR